MYNGQKEKYIAAVFTFSHSPNVTTAATVRINNTAQTRFLAAVDGTAASLTTGAQTDAFKIVMVRPGRLKNLFYRAFPASTLTNSTHKFTVLKNGAVPPAPEGLSAFWNPATKSGSDIGGYINVLPGDTISVQLQIIAGGTGYMERPTVSFELEVEPDANYVNQWDLDSGLTSISYLGGKVGIGTGVPTEKLHVSGGKAMFDGEVHIGPAGKLVSDDSVEAKTGLIGRATGVGGTAGLFDANSGAKIFSGQLAGVEKFSVDESGNVFAANKVGIGVPTPTAELEVAGTVHVTGFKLTDPATPNPNNFVLTADASGVGKWLPSSGVGGVGTSGDAEPTSIAKFTSGTTIEESSIYESDLNHIGLGTADPQEKLTLAQNSNLAVEMEIPIIESVTAQPGGDLTPGLDYFFRIVAEDGSGGTTTGSLAQGQFNPSGGNNSCLIQWTAVQGAKRYSIYIGNTTGAQDRYFTSLTNLFTYTTDDGVISTDPVTGLPPVVPEVTTAYINKLSAAGPSWLLGGKVGIGTANPTASLEVAGLVRIGALDFAKVNGVRWRGAEIFVSPAMGLGPPRPQLRLIGAEDDAGIGRIGLFGETLIDAKLDVTGQIFSSAGYCTGSSRRWKKNIRAIKGALSKVQSLRGVLYNQVEDEKTNIGLVAEEVGEVIPEIVIYEENGKDAQGLDYSRLVAVLIEAVKEQQGQIEELKDTLKSLLADKTKAAGLA